jgi:hypothetical protein
MTFKQTGIIKRGWALDKDETSKLLELQELNEEKTVEAREEFKEKMERSSEESSEDYEEQ